MAEGKWIPGLTATTSLATAARRALTLRLETVRQQLQPATERAHEDTEHVHQLRVATRRCRAAIDLFSEVLPEKLHDGLRRLLRRIRRSAGPARDWDVFQLALAPRLVNATARTSAGLNWLAGQMAARRALAQDELRDAYPKLAKGLRHLAEETAHVKESGGSNGSMTPLAHVARAELTPLVDALETTGREDLTNPEHSHRLRIEGKRLRYAMEVFADCFAPDFRETLYPQVEQLQEHLGEVNDAHVAITVLATMQAHAQEFYPQFWTRWQPGVTALRSSQRRRLKLAQQRCERFWRTMPLQELRAQVETPSSERSLEVS